MLDAFDLDKFGAEIAELQQQIEATRKDAFDTMREVVAYRLFGGPAALWDEEEVVFVRVDDSGAPAEIRVTADWKDEYTAEELGQVIAVLAKELEAMRVERAERHIRDYPEDLAAISDEEVERMFTEAQAKAETTSAHDFRAMEEVAAQLDDQLTQLEAETAPLRAGTPEVPSIERPVSMVVMGGMLVGIQINPEFINRSTTVQINAAFADEIIRVNSGEDDVDESATARLRATSAKARAYAEILQAQTNSASSAFTRN